MFLTAVNHAAVADQLTLIWNPSREPAVIGYVVYVGARPGVHTESHDLGSTTSFVLGDARPGQQYCFAVAAYARGPLLGAKSQDVCGFSDAPPLLLNPGDQSSVLLRPVSLGLRGGDPYGQPVTYKVTGLPPGLTVATSTGVIAGIPTKVGFYSATATVSDGLLSTSQSFAWTVRETPPPDPPPPPSPPPPATPPSITVDSVSPRTGTGTSAAFTLRYSHSAGAASLATVSVWFHALESSRRSDSCLVQFDRQANRLSLLDDAGSRWQDGKLGGLDTLRNSSCEVAADDATVSLEGETMTLRLPITFTLRFSGTKDVDMQAVGVTGAMSGWKTRGSWTVPGPVMMQMWSKALTASKYRVILQYSNIARRTDLEAVSAWFHPASETETLNSCLVRYDLAPQRLSLLGDRGVQWSSATLGSPGTLRNGQCAISFDGRTTAVLIGDTLTLTFDVSFTARFDRTKAVFLSARSTDGTTSSWETRRSWALE